MISTADFKTGLTILYDNNIYQIIEFLHVKPGKGQAYVNSKLKNLRTGATIDYTFRAGEKMKQANIERVKMQYLYRTDNTFVFMNQDTYDQVEINLNQISEEAKYLYETLEVEIIYFERSEILGLVLPDKISLTVTETVPGVKGDTKTNALKDAVLETGLLVKVPLFINQGEKIIISTQDGSYVARDNR
ncbi:MAG: elongation factor P [Acholeplasmatales bacterium]|jgi:elongation factor P|nr:elongation factor P [Acholeplasmataceae bacterium]MDY0115203.1 elongation factor P [Acholeplasmatales bacterium]MCK9233676.1 elongation factor P [Acholeplasmataceae bacterium]MCK9288935.1 elongation factor P [Acholeplasmataceae bacterium]MCK9427529.1 elongation factor P [Acholeplasmataceae bacterium]